MCAEILTDDQLSLAYWECNNRLLIKTSHSILLAIRVIITLSDKITDCCSERMMEGQYREQAVI